MLQTHCTPSVSPSCIFFPLPATLTTVHCSLSLALFQTSFPLRTSLATGALPAHYSSASRISPFLSLANNSCWCYGRIARLLALRRMSFSFACYSDNCAMLVLTIFQASFPLLTILAEGAMLAFYPSASRISFFSCKQLLVVRQAHCTPSVSPSRVSFPLPATLTTVHCPLSLVLRRLFFC